MTSERRWLRCVSIGAFVALCSSSSGACEPVVPFIRVVGGPAILTGSAIALPIAIGLKSLLFAFLQKRLRYSVAVMFMIAGNILTTFIGVIVAAMIGSGAAWLFGIPIVWALCWLPSKRMVAVSSRQWVQHLSPGLLSFFMTGALVVSCVLFLVGQAAILADRLAFYWVIKFAAVYLALLVSILLSAFWEEWVVWRLSRLPQEQTFMVPVVRANLYVMLLIMLFGAAMMLPKRLKSPDFLVQSYRHIVASVSR
jgi:hypothetical protein